MIDFSPHFSSDSMDSDTLSEIFDEPEFCRTKQNQLKLVHNEFQYTKLRSSFTKTYWRCCRNQRYDCKGKAITRKIGHKEIVIAYDNHNHLPN